MTKVQHAVDHISERRKKISVIQITKIQIKTIKQKNGHYSHLNAIFSENRCLVALHKRFVMNVTSITLPHIYVIDITQKAVDWTVN